MKRKKQKLNQEEKVKIALRTLSDEQIDSLSPTELRILLKGEQQIRKVFEEGYHQALALNKELENKCLIIEGKLINIKCRLFSPKSERSRPEKKPTEVDPKPKRRPLKKIGICVNVTLMPMLLKKRFA